MKVKLGWRTSHEQTVFHRDRGRPTFSWEHYVVRLGGRVARDPKEQCAEVVRRVEQNEEGDDEPFHPAITESEQGDSERRLAASYSNDRGETRDVAQNTKGKEVLERHLIETQTKAETRIGCRRCAAGEEEDLEHSSQTCDAPKG